MLVFTKILVPVDGSDHSNRAVEYAFEIASKFDSKLILLHVYSFTPPIPSSTILPGPPNYGIMLPETKKSLSQKAKKDAKKILIQAKKFVKSKDVAAKSLLREGKVVSEILKVVEVEKVDLIVMGARGIGGIKKLVLGSTSETITHKVICPVLIVR